MARYLGAAKEVGDLTMFVVKVTEQWTPPLPGEDITGYGQARYADQHHRTHHKDGTICAGHVAWYGPYATKSGANAERNRNRNRNTPRTTHFTATAVTYPLVATVGDPV